MCFESLLTQVEQSYLPRQMALSKPGIRTHHHYLTPSPLAPTRTTFDAWATGNHHPYSSLYSFTFSFQPRARLDCIRLVRSHHQALGSLTFIESATHTAPRNVHPSGIVRSQGVGIRTCGRPSGEYGRLRRSRACHSHVGSSRREANRETRWAYRQHSRDSYIRRREMCGLRPPLLPYFPLISDSLLQLLTASADGTLRFHGL